jgi:hypothetical protein
VARWLLTIGKDADLSALRRDVAERGGSINPDLAIPLDLNEQLVEADGPEDLPQRLQDHPAIRKVSPESQKFPYGPQ